MIAKFRPLALALAAAFGIFACNAERPSDPASEGTGSARVKLPTVPQGYVPDSALDSAGHSVFRLAITGPDMSPILKSWELKPGSVEKAVITGIPVGWPRVFTGTLIWVTAWGDTLNTHEGRDSVAITMDSIAQVSLFLRKIGSSGSAEVCVEVEGWDADPDCVKPPRAIDINGCWKISVAYPQSTREGSLSIQQRDTSVFMVITWDSGAKDSSLGTLNRDVLYMGRNYGMPGFHLKGMVLDSGFGIGAEYRGDGDSLPGQLQAFRGPCDTVVPPPPQDSLPDCYFIVQSLNGKSMMGNLSLEQAGSSAWGTIGWNGLQPMDVNGFLRTAPDTSFLQLTGVAPKDMLDSAGNIADTVQYRSGIRSEAFTVFTGSVFRLQPAGWKEIGIWKASPQSCPADSSRQE